MMFYKYKKKTKNNVTKIVFRNNKNYFGVVIMPHSGATHGFPLGPPLLSNFLHNVYVEKINYN